MVLYYYLCPFLTLFLFHIFFNQPPPHFSPRDALISRRSRIIPFHREDPENAWNVVTRKREGVNRVVMRPIGFSWRELFISETKAETAVICRTRGGIQIGSCFDRSAQRNSSICSFFIGRQFKNWNVLERKKIMTSIPLCGNRFSLSLSLFCWLIKANIANDIPSNVCLR